MKMPDVRPLPEDLQQIAIEELNEVPERIAEDIAALKTWIEQQPYLKARTTDQYLLSFLRGCKFSLEKAKSKIDKYYTLRTKYPDFYTIQNVDDPKVLKLIKLGIGVPLPVPLNGNGPRIMLIRPGCYPPDAYTFDEVMCVANTLRQITMFEDDYANVNGTIDILDLSQITKGHIFQMTPTVIKKMSIFAEEAVPLRQKATHFINTPALFEPVFNMLKPLMPIKQQERVCMAIEKKSDYIEIALFVHGSKFDELYKHVPKKYLPKEYDGENGSIAEMIETAVQKYLEYRNYYIEDLKYGTIEELRPVKTVDDYDMIFGMVGSFRKLNVD